MRIYSVPYTAGQWRGCKNWEMFPLPLWVYEEEMVPFLWLPLPLLFLKMLMLFLSDSFLKLKSLWFWTRKKTMHYWCLGPHLSDICWLLVLSCGSDCEEFGGHLQSWGPVISAMPPGLLWHPHFQAKLCLWWASRDALEESYFLPELWTSSFPSGIQNDPFTHEQRYFFGKSVSISSLHTSQHSIFPTCQAKYAVVYPDFPFLSGTKQAGGCAQGFVNQGATWQFYELCVLLSQLTFPLLPVVPWILLLLHFLRFWTCWMGSCVQNLPIFVLASSQVTMGRAVWEGGSLMSVMVMTRKQYRVNMAAYPSATDVQV